MIGKTLGHYRMTDQPIIWRRHSTAKQKSSRLGAAVIEYRGRRITATTKEGQP